MLLLLFADWAALCLPAAAQMRVVEEGVAPGVTFTLRLAEGRTHFKQGERIPIELVFSSSLPNTYQVNTASYDRSGRLRMDKFLVEPQDGWTDPMKEYFASQGGFIGGGLYGVPTLNGEPQVIALDLNEWFRFDKPGTYRLRMESPRVSRLRTGEDVDEPNVVYHMTSNDIVLHIEVADSAWAAQELARNLQILEASVRPENAAEFQRACRAVRYLGSREAVPALVQLLGKGYSGCDFHFMIGLYDTPHKQTAVEELRRGLRAPDQPVSSTYLLTLANLSYLQQTQEALPPYPRENEAKQREWQAQYKERQAARTKMQDDFARELEKALPRKMEAARALSVDTLAQLTISEGRHHRSAAEAARFESLRQELARSFLALPSDRQSAYLAWGWRAVQGPEFVPVLKQLFEAKTDENYFDRGLPLRRLYQIVPNEGRELILAEIQRPEPRVGAKTLGILPERTLPELDDTLASSLEQGIEQNLSGAFTRHSGLIARYATETILLRVKAVYEKDQAAGWLEVQTALLNYFLRVDPEYGLKKLRAAAVVPCSGCYRTILTDVAQRNRSPQIEALALELLGHDDPGISADAATMLGKYGSADAKAALWKRLERWHMQWKDNAAKLRSSYTSENPLRWEAELGGKLLAALMQARSWVLGEEELAALRERCLLQNCAWQIDQQIRSLSGPHMITYYEFEEMIWLVDGLQLESFDAVLDKASQYPPGTQFQFSFADPNDPKIREYRETLKSQLERLGMRVMP